MTMSGSPPLADAYRLCGRHLRYKGIAERGLPDPCLTGDRYELAASLLGQSPPLLELCQFPSRAMGVLYLVVSVALLMIPARRHLLCFGTIPGRTPV
jgi:hypothetical protein